uniref:Uncharacterized protein n=1 Tax=Romanomermis culicivorax TaxID=13658 RepID=A0A915J440_ROMCU
MDKKSIPMKVGTPSVLIINFAIFCICNVRFGNAETCGCPAIVQADDAEEEEQNLDQESDSEAADQSSPKVNDETAFEDKVFSSILGSGASAAVLPPTSTVSPFEHCPAAKAPKSNQYLSYDPRYQAITIEEAVFNFVDLTEIDGRLEEMNNLFGGRPKFFDQQSGLPNGLKLKCDSTLCSDCTKILASKLEYDTTVERNIHNEDPILARDTVVKQAFRMNFGGKSNDHDKPYCRLLNKTGQNYRKVKRQKMRSSELYKILNAAKISRNVE